MRFLVSSFSFQLIQVTLVIHGHKVLLTEGNYTPERLKWIRLAGFHLGLPSTAPVCHSF